MILSLLRSRYFAVPMFLSLNTYFSLFSGQDTGIHWGWFMSSMIWGNSITLLLTTHTPDPETLRMTVYSILGSLSLLGTLCYVFLRPTAGSISSNFDNERAALLDGVSVVPRFLRATINSDDSVCVEEGVSCQIMSIL